MATTYYAPDPIQSMQFIPGGIVPANGGQLFFYAAGTSTKQTVYKDNAAAVAWSNPIVLDSGGNLPSGGEVWFSQGVTYKVVFAPSNDTDPPASPYWTKDNLSGMNDVSAASSLEWITGSTPTFVSTTSFTVSGDLTGTLTAGRRIKSTNTGGTIYSTILNATFGGGLTTVTVVNDSGVLDAGMTAFSYGLLSSVNPSTPLLTDAYPIVSGSTDKTKKLLFEIDQFTASTSRTLFVNDEDMTVANTWETRNFTVSSFVSSNALTVAFKTKKLTDASALDPIFIKYRNVTSGVGDYSIRTITSAASITLASTGTLGTVSSTAHRLYFGAFDNAGVLTPFMYNPYATTGPTLVGIAEDVQYSAAAANSSLPQAIYAITTVSSKFLRLLGYVEVNQTTAGAWVTAPSRTQLLKFGDKKTGDVVQSQYFMATSSGTGNTQIPLNNSAPNNTQGDQYMTQSITPTNAANFLKIRSSVIATYTVAGAGVTMALFQDSGGNAIRCSVVTVPANGYMTAQQMFHGLLANTTSSTTFKIRVGNNNGTGTLTFNGQAGAALFQQTMGSDLQVDEIFV